MSSNHVSLTASDPSLQHLERMVLCRQFELFVERMALSGEIRGMAHLGIGQEAIAAGVTALLGPHDWINGTYRNISLALCMGVPPVVLFGELLGKSEGLCGGYGGHMHLFDLPRRFLGTDPVVGAAMALGAGAALSLKTLPLADASTKKGGVAVSFFGEGALGTGISHEVLNLASLWSLPVLFVIENNGYAISTPILAGLAGSVMDRAKSYSITAETTDGNDVLAVEIAARKLLNRVREERCPALLEARTYRQRGHSKSDTRNYRSKNEELLWMKKDPLKILANNLEQNNLLPADGLRAMSASVDEKLAQALQEARAMPECTVLRASRPPVGLSDSFEYTGGRDARDTNIPPACGGGGQECPPHRGQERPPHRGQECPPHRGQECPPHSGQECPPHQGQELPPHQVGQTFLSAGQSDKFSMQSEISAPLRSHQFQGELGHPSKTISYRQAINEALTEELERDPSVIFLGQDVGVFGGAYKASVGLQERFGKERVIDTPISELGVCQMLVGAAMTGLRPIFEVMFGDFLALCADAIINHAAKFRYVSGGSVRVPLVIRAPFGPGNGFGATHSQSVERWFAHVPGLIVAVPSTPADVKSMLKAAIRCNDPVLLLEPISLYANTGPVPMDEEGLRLEAWGLGASSAIQASSLKPQAFFGARLVLSGTRVTCVSYGRALYPVLAACERSAGGTPAVTPYHPTPAGGTPTLQSLVEVIDLRCILPLDRETILKSVRKTGALLVVEDDHLTFGIGGELIALVVEAGIPLRHVCRLAGTDTPIPFSANMEGSAFPNSNEIHQALGQMVK